jgi:hypothetical protein
LGLPLHGFKLVDFQPAEDAPEMFRNAFAASLWTGLAIFAVGCGSSSGDAPKTVPVKGTVTVEGKPMGKLGVVFMPEKGKGKIATGETDGEGHFSLMTNVPGDGAPVGTYSVSITPVEENNPPMPGMEGYKKPGPPPFARKYTDLAKSGLKATVDSDPSKNDFKFDLTEK